MDFFVKLKKKNLTDRKFRYSVEKSVWKILE